MKKIFFTFLFLMPFFLQPLRAEDSTLTERAAKAEALVNTIWQKIGDVDIAGLDNMMADSFQSVHEDGSRDKEAELELIKALKPGGFKLSDMRITEAGADVLIVTYKCAVVEHLNGKETSGEPAARMSIFQNVEGDWKWVAHANLETM